MKIVIPSRREFENHTRRPKSYMAGTYWLQDCLIQIESEADPCICSSLRLATTMILEGGGFGPWPSISATGALFSLRARLIPQFAPKGPLHPASVDVASFCNSLTDEPPYSVGSKFEVLLKDTGRCGSAIYVSRTSLRSLSAATPTT